MVYSDLLFLLGVLPVSVLVSFFDKSTEYKNLILVLTSLAFFSWGKPFAVCLIFLTAVAEWALGLWIEKLRNKGGKSLLPLLIDVIMNVAVLFLMTRFFLFLKEDAFGFAKYVISVGISFYVLRGFAYVYDVYKGNIKAEQNVFCLLTYMCGYFFNVTGLALRYGEIEPQIRDRKLSVYGINDGLNHIVYGLGKSVIIASVLKTVGETCLESKVFTVAGSWIGMISMAGFGYFLYTGFSDISYGLARIYGFELNKNYRDLTAKGLSDGVFCNLNKGVTDFISELYSNIPSKIKLLGLPLIGGLVALWCRQTVTALLVGVVIGLIVLAEKTVLKGFFEKAPAVFRLVVTYLPAVVLVAGLVTEGYFTVLKGIVGIGTAELVTKTDGWAVLNNIFVIAIAGIMMLMPFIRKAKAELKDYSVMSVEKYGRVHLVKTIFTAIIFVVCIILITAGNVKL